MASVSRSRSNNNNSKRKKPADDNPSQQIELEETTSTTSTTDKEVDNEGKYVSIYVACTWVDFYIVILNIGNFCLPHLLSLYAGYISKKDIEPLKNSLDTTLASISKLSKQVSTNQQLTTDILEDIQNKITALSQKVDKIAFGDTQEVKIADLVCI